MASVVDICNLALANIAHRAEVTAIVPPDGSKEAALCNRFYPIARDLTLEMGEWGFAKRRVVLASLGSPPDEWEYRYAYPTNVIKPLQVYTTGSDPNVKPEGEKFDIEDDDTDGRVIVTNVDDAELMYIHRITDTTKFSPSFVDALGWTLASYLAGALPKDLKLAQYCRDMAAMRVGEAMKNDANTVKAKLKSNIALRYPVPRPRRSSITDA